MYLTDADLLAALKKTADHLVIDEDGNSGLVIVKENVKSHGVYLDKEDNSLIRSIKHFEAIFKDAGLEVLHGSFQPGWP